MKGNNDDNVEEEQPKKEPKEEQEKEEDSGSSSPMKKEKWSTMNQIRGVRYVKKSEKISKNPTWKTSSSS